ncbi:ribosome biogenesis ATPase RIX7 [Fomitiporia mediterranea MF3/22]|uniref:ribosome biogenesis ATPase RIX7 n=1 Tax=Fomitiporia mediterranea (strain MF3/22) TaxID=694068 RepID=UPI0004409848|nr:ribosome biogenesis ATPase RIX7 [Fomitiporia mediterranea MF3/22]EJD06507.1 ribosome biogenesis ATPase RIX7 [Fomitiporia mediterranea MF3/22]
MEISGRSALNKSMQGLWSTQRRGKVNLNSSVVSAPASPPGTPKVGESSASTIPPKEDQNGSAISAADNQASVELTDGQSEPRPPTSGVKRKLRPSRTANAEEASKRYKSSLSSKDYSPPSTRLSDLGGVEACVEKMLELVAMPLCHPEVYLHTGVQPPRGVLLHGPPGCGKTLLANAIAGELGVPFISVSAPSIVSGMSGESEKTLRDTFEEAKKNAPCLLFIDEIDAITPKRESAQREMERRIVAQFLTCMDDMSWDKTDNKPVIVIGATNRPDSLDAALRRAGRFDHEISMGVPDEEARAQILRVFCSRLRIEGGFDFQALAKATPGYVGADLAALTGAAGVIAVKRIFQQLSDGTIVLPEPDVLKGAEDGMAIDSGDASGMVSQTVDRATEPLKLSTFTNLPQSLQSNSIVHFLVAHPNPLTEAQLTPLFISYVDFTQALKQVQPSSKREGFTTVPDVTWADIGALHTIREELHMAIVQPIRRPELFKRVGISAPCGVLLWGPPGCGKTLLAKAVANESGANFISVKGPELLNKYVGESERAVRQVFARARASSPCVIFFDELDALVPRRDDSLSESSARMVNTLLTELDGLDERRGVHVIGATNRPDMLDPAMCRPGRLDKLLYVDLPTADERVEITRTVSRTVPLAGGDEAKVALGALVRERCEGFSGADLSALVREAGVNALRRAVFKPTGDDMDATTESEDVNVSLDDFRLALTKLGPSVSQVQRKKYAAMRNKFAGMSLRFTKGVEADADEVPNEVETTDSSHKI